MNLDVNSMKKIALFIISIAFSLDCLMAQNQEKKEIINFGVEVGAYVLTKDVAPPENVRFSERGAHAYYIPWNIGAMGEFLFGQGMFGVGTGLRLTSYTAYYGGKKSKHPYEWNMDPSTVDGHYIGLYSIKQSNNYLGFPVTFRIFFVPKEKVVRPYFKLDLAFNFLVANKNTIKFVEPDTPLNYIDQINNDLGDPEKFNSTLDFAYGLRIGKDPFYINAELHYPSFLLTDSPVSFFQTSDLTMLNFGFKVGLQVPISWREYKERPEVEEEIQSEMLPEGNEMEKHPIDENGAFKKDNGNE